LKEARSLADPAASPTAADPAVIRQGKLQSMTVYPDIIILLDTSYGGEDRLNHDGFEAVFILTVPS